MAIVRTYECGDCGTKFDKIHFDRSEPPPECPGCQALAARQVPAGFSIGGSTHGKAVDITQKIIEQDYGMTDMKDNLRQGDTAVPLAPNLAPAVNNFWTPNNQALAAAKAGAAASKAEGRNPLTIIQKVQKSRGPTAAQVLCRPVNSVR